MTTNNGELMLLDAASLYFRAFYGVPESITAPDGTPVNAVRGFIDMIARLVSTRQPTRLIACLDADWRPAFRVAALPSYKAHRVAPESGESIPDPLAPQVDIICDVLDAVGIAMIGIPGFEADDVIGSVVAQETTSIEVVTGDRDLFQVVRDASPDRGAVQVLYTARGVSNLQVFGEREVAEKYGIPGRRYADFAVLRGDPSDGLPGVAGIGDKTAAALITRFGSLEGVVTATKDNDAAGFPAGARAKMLAAADYVAAAEQVVEVRKDLDLPAINDQLPTEPADPARLVQLSDRWGITSPLNRLLRALQR